MKTLTALAIAASLAAGTALHGAEAAPDPAAGPPAMPGATVNAPTLSAAAQRMIEVNRQLSNADPYVSHDGVGVSYLYGFGSPELVCAPIKVCALSLQPGERIQRGGVQTGDSTRWQIGWAIGPHQTTMLLVKPVQGGLETNMTILTDRRIYSIRLVSTERDYVPMLSFRYPPDEWAAASVAASGNVGAQNTVWDQYHEATGPAHVVADATERTVGAGAPDRPPPAFNPADMDYAYRVRGCRKCDSWMPVTVFHNGTSTYIRLPDEYAGPLPAFSALGHDGEHQAVNARWRGKTLQVDAIFERGYLTLGRREVEITWTGAGSRS